MKQFRHITSDEIFIFDGKLREDFKKEFIFIDFFPMSDDHLRQS